MLFKNLRSPIERVELRRAELEKISAYELLTLSCQKSKYITKIIDSLQANKRLPKQIKLRLVRIGVRQVTSPP
jgi:hypothetical protein